MITKLEISPEMQAFNDAVETADVLLDHSCDRYSAIELLIKLENQGCYPYACRALAEAMAAIAVKR